MDERVMKKFLFFILIASSFFISAYAEPIPNYYKPYAPITTDKKVYSWTDKVRVAIDAPSWNENRNGIDSIGDIQGYHVSISTHSHKLEPYKLVETSTNSGYFTGEITLTGFSHDANGDGRIDTSPRTFGSGPTNGYLEADRDDGITISFEFADGVVVTQSAQIRWNDGKITFDQQTYLPNNIARIQVIDPDMNLNPESNDTVQIEISSDTDLAGIKIDATETDIDSGVFIGWISFSSKDKSSGNRLHANLDDNIYAKYVDYTLPSPFGVNDNLQITTVSTISTNSSTVDQVTLENLGLTDNSGKIVNKPALGQQLLVASEIKNTQDYGQNFVYLVQITNSRGVVVSLSWVKGSIDVGQKLGVAQSWIPDDTGTYTVRTFVWKSLDNIFPLAPSQEEVYNINE